MALSPLEDLSPKSDIKGGAADDETTQRWNNPSPYVPPNGRWQINSSTGISVGLLIILIVGIWTILGAINSTKNEMASTRLEINTRFDKVESRVSNVEGVKNSWSAVDMFRWATHLQQANPQLKVPEPEVSK